MFTYVIIISIRNLSTILISMLVAVHVAFLLSIKLADVGIKVSLLVTVLIATATFYTAYSKSI